MQQEGSLQGKAILKLFNKAINKQADKGQLENIGESKHMNFFTLKSAFGKNMIILIIKIKY